ncbi:MAG: LLM class flavin-dependent oxidoreductase, partial [Chloroflexi bacterium]|nr:LLM class flavin-dependent oxidoreductase [Chloroflexota bacterium]
QQVPHPPVWIPGALSLETMSEVARRGYTYFLSTRAHLSQSKAAAHRFAEVVATTGGEYTPYRMGLLLSVFVGETDEEARRESQDGIWYFLRNCLKGHLRRKGRMLTFAPGATSVRSWEAYLRNSDPTAKMLGDADDWAELDGMGSIIVGSPETVRRRLWEYVQECQVGYFMIQFHIGNMAPAVVRKSQQLFATEVAPYLRAESADLFAKAFPQLADMAPTAPVVGA